MDAAAPPEEIKLYFDYKSPFAFLASGPAFDLDRRFRVRVRWIPYQLRIKGKGERSQNSEWKAKYSYLDARRFATPRGLVIKGPRKVYDTEPALIGALFAMHAGCFQRYTEEAYARFFRRELELDVPTAIAALLAECGASAFEYEAFLAGEGAREYARCVAEAEADHVFGVPLFLFRDEPFWGHDRLPLLEACLRESGLER
ncbi:MAG: disulfide bond formation protein DsbA [Deltaproteobacteria bacterium]|nr:MAG: disulfide bond formation protein DsbA [Deltaproteobacteria bacterium]